MLGDIPVEARKTSPKRKSKSAPATAPVTLTQPQQEAFIHFIEYHPSKRFSRNLRKMLLEYLMMDGAVESDDLLYDLEGLFEVLDGESPFS